MRLRTASIRDFRNITAAEIDFSPTVTCLLGPNGQGKTNAIEALYLIAALRPLRNVVRRALIRSGADETSVHVEVEHARTGLTHRLGVTLKGSGRILEKDDKRCDASQFLGHAVAIAFTPDDLQLAKGGPDGRRRFLDRALLNVRPAYLRSALRYQKAVRDRNRLLVEDAPDTTLDAFDAVLAREGATITAARASYAKELTPLVQARFVDIAHPAPVLALRYRSALDPASLSDPLEDAFYGALVERRPRDRRRKTTSVGPHLDDLVVTLDGAPARDRASQGQHRALVLALKLAEIEHLAKALGEPPILLLDDMSSELDATRSRQLFEAVRRLEGQVVLTSTEDPTTLLRRLGHADDVQIYRVDSGNIRAPSPTESA